MSDTPSLRQRTTSSSSTATADNLPPPRPSKPMKKVSAPLTSTRLSRLIYIVVLLAALLTFYYSYRIVQWKTEVGGWWNLALGRRPSHLQNHDPTAGSESRKASKGRSGKGERESVEDRINALAQALGMPSKELASAIAVAVREYVPPASLSSVAAQETGPAVKAMIKGDENTEDQGADSERQNSGVVGGVLVG